MYQSDIGISYKPSLGKHYQSAFCWYTTIRSFSLFCPSLSPHSSKLSLKCRHVEIISPFLSQDLMNNSPYCLAYNSCDISSDNLLLDWSTKNPIINICVYSPCLSVWYCKEKFCLCHLLNFKGSFNGCCNLRNVLWTPLFNLTLAQSYNHDLVTWFKIIKSGEI